MAIPLGMNGKLYYGAAGAELAEMTELTLARDVTINLERADADVTTRANDKWRATASTLAEMTIEFQLAFDPEDSGVLAIQSAAYNNTQIELAALTGSKSTAGSTGPKGTFVISAFTRNEALEEAMTIDVTAKLYEFDELVVVPSS